MIQSLADKKPVLLRKTATSSIWEDNDYRVYWEGLVFISGVLSGKDSIRVFIEELKLTNINNAIHLLKGVYFLMIEDKSTDDFYAFVDNSGMYQAFYTKNMISNSFLELVKYNKYKVSDFDPDAVIEFSYFGYLFFNKTFFKSISRFPGDKIFHFSQRSNKITSISKNVPDINDDSGKGVEYFDQEFEGLAASLRNCRVSIDLTGGVDSRLIAVLLGVYGLTIEAAVAAGTADYEELLRSEVVADSLNVPWYGTIHSINSLEEDFSELFYATDGLISLTDYHCMFKLQKKRLQRGVDTVISGAGGDFFKDIFWLQDFPFYFKRTANIERLVDTRLMKFKPVQSLLAHKYANSHQSLRSKIIQGLDQYRLESCTKTYDNICFKFLMREMGGRDLTNHSFYMKAYAPFLDLDIVRMGFNLPVTMRIFNKFHRNKLTKLNPLIASLPTTEGGMSASSNPLLMLRDVPKFMSNRVKRLLIKLSLRKQPIINYNHPDFYFNVRKMSLMIDSIEILKEAGIVSKNTRIEQLDNIHLGTFFTLAKIVNYMSEHA